MGDCSATCSSGWTRPSLVRNKIEKLDIITDPSTGSLLNIKMHLEYLDSGDISIEKICGESTSPGRS